MIKVWTENYHLNHVLKFFLSDKVIVRPILFPIIGPPGGVAGTKTNKSIKGTRTALLKYILRYGYYCHTKWVKNSVNSAYEKSFPEPLISKGWSSQKSLQEK